MFAVSVSYILVCHLGTLNSLTIYYYITLRTF